MSNNNTALKSTFTPFRSGCGICKGSTDYYNVKYGGGDYSKNGLIPEVNGKNFYQAKNFQLQLDNKFVKDNLGVDYATSFGGKKPSVKKPIVKKLSGVKKPIVKKPSGVKKTSIKKPIVKNTSNKKPSILNKIKGLFKGGEAPFNLDFIKNTPFEDTLSGGKKTKTTKAKTTKVKTTKVKTTKAKTTKAKTTKKTMKGGQESSGATPMNQRFYDLNSKLDNYPQNSGDGVMSAYGPIKVGDVGTGMLAPYTASSCPSANHNTTMKTGGKKNVSKLSKVKKNMKGGQESSSATPMDQRFYVPTSKLGNYPQNSGDGVMSAYGPIKVGDIGTGMLAPYTASSCPSANHNTTMKTGGKKNLNNKIGGKGGPIPSISDKPVTTVQKLITGSLKSFTGFLGQLDKSYDKSIDNIKSIKIGNQRLIRGGNKKKKSTIKKIKKGGSNGSDFALTLNSRGPCNAPDDYWGVPGEKWFRQFNKTGEYIPNSQLQYAATPTLAGSNPSGVVTGYDEQDLNYIQM